MKSFVSKVISAFCVACMVITSSAAVFAADVKPSISVELSNDKRSADISIKNAGGYFYSAQLTLDAKGSGVNYTLSNSDKGKYSVVNREDGDIVLYVDFNDIADGSKTVKLATLKANKEISIGSRADLILLNRSMRPTEYKNITVSVKSSGSNSNSGSSSGSSSGTTGWNGGPVIYNPQPVTPTQPVGGFVDVPSDFWASDSIKYVAEKGVFKGVENNKFEPHAQMTRAMYVTVLSRFGEKLGNGWNIPCDNPMTFVDVADGQWYTNAVAWAGGTGLVNGIGEGKFGPDVSITREQIAVMTVNFARLCNKIPAADNAEITFTDSDAISEWAKESVSLAQRMGLIQGREDGKFAPQDTATRAEVAAILSRFLQKVN